MRGAAAPIAANACSRPYPKFRAGAPKPRDLTRCIGIYVVSSSARQNAAAAVCAVVYKKLTPPHLNP